MTKKYSKIVLTVIAAALVAMVVRPILPWPFGDCGRYRSFRCQVYIVTDIENNVARISDALESIEERMPK